LRAWDFSLAERARVELADPLWGHALSRRAASPVAAAPKCPPQDSNLHCTDFESVASAGWARRANGAGGIRTLTDQFLRLVPLPVGLQRRVTEGARIELARP